MEKRFNPELLHKLDNPERRAVLPPDKLLDMLHIQNGHTVVDLGAGAGYFTIPAAGMTKSTVYAVDVQPKMLEHLQERAMSAGHMHIEYVEGDLEQIPLPDCIADHVIVSMVLHEVESLSQTLQEIDRVMKPGANLLIIEWQKKHSEQGPRLHHRIDPTEMAAALEKQGLHVDTQSYPSEQLYLMIASKPQ